MTKTFTITLSRAHKIVERLNAEITLANGRMATKATVSVSFPVVDMAGFRNKTSEQNKALLTEVENINGLLDVIGTIRQKVGAANIKAGVSDKLSQIEVLNRKMGVLRQVQNLVSTNGLSEHAETEIARIGKLISDASGKEMPPTVAQLLIRPREFGVVALTEVEDFEVKVRSMTREVRRLSDAVNQANQKTIQVELDETLAETLGL